MKEHTEKLESELDHTGPVLPFKESKNAEQVGSLNEMLEDKALCTTQWITTFT